MGGCTGAGGGVGVASDPHCEHVFVLIDNPNAKGAIAELKIATAATCLGIPVLRPMTERGRYDLAFEVGGRILRVQCKWAGVRKEPWS